ncbi:uncharacterized protein FFB20_05079 [Fusarium fujikuroi]|uniref:Uncharacterized protein n=1 Tax=Gibberella fujikuroi (strain CBS 195.34 / IMI 58289 / NRRL A-6831) TaxID=1279085 RepID=S0DNQ1_GIBF5|nr:uncharacterized protein FFUJ_01243 [Fusarium fujikuroi IMI 58289]KLP16229.1 uncharacterized protein LW94_9370 [Fusarium fujikuroi]CCT62223.1 uncharacterized protein FFUJ_01243 [Fusarium fujikuroi IMI 58289]SCN67951.1 uncharacterized protein FFE2_01330 [Fusarium fujikuroi]SCN75318.1 uncharacterized protein FFM5_01281 [Fusarium fujikuroi]SCN75925.1 uncharacterized protein FFB20_05079 [Fusarium fujikuroi]
MAQLPIIFELTQADCDNDVYLSLDLTSISQMEGCTVDEYEATISFERWAYDEAMRRWEIIMHPYTDLTVEPLWYRKEPVIEPLMSMLMQKDRIVDPAALSEFT